MDPSFDSELEIAEMYWPHILQESPVSMDSNECVQYVGYVGDEQCDSWPLSVEPLAHREMDQQRTGPWYSQ